MIDPKSVKIVSQEAFLDFFEKLSRGFSNSEPTLVSESFALKIEKILKDNDCLNERGELLISHLLQALHQKAIHINLFNKCLRSTF